MIRLFKNKYLHLIVGLLALLLMHTGPRFNAKEKVDAKAFSAKLHAKELFADQLMQELLSFERVDVLFSLSDKYIALTKQEGVSFFILENGENLFWTSRAVSFDPSLSDFPNERGVANLKNGWYEYRKVNNQGRIYLSLIQIQQTAPIANSYFEQHFHPSFDVTCPSEVVLAKGEHEIYALDGEYLFSINELKEGEGLVGANNWFAFVFFLIGMLFCFSFISKITRAQVKLRPISPIVMVVLILSVRAVLLLTSYFGERWGMELFSPIVFAQSTLLPSLGALILNAIFYLLLVYYFSKAVHSIASKSKVMFFVFAIGLAFIPMLIADVIQGLIVNSKINFDVNYLLDLDVYSFIGISSIAIFFVATILLFKIVINHFMDKAFKRNQLIPIFWCLNLVAVIVGHFNLDLSFFLTGWVLFVVMAFSFKSNSKVSFYRSAFLIFIVAITISYGFIHHSKEKDQTNKEFIAKKLAKEQDPVAEYLFQNIEEKIKSDTLLINQLSNYWDKKEEINKHILNRYFGGFWTKYDVNIIYPCNNSDSILIEPDNINVNCLAFFNDKIERESNNPFSTNKTLNFLYSAEGISSYLAKIKIRSNEQDYYLFMEMFPKVFSKAVGYPDLLLDDKNSMSRINTNQYSYAKYKKDRLVDNLGEFNYNIELAENYRFNDDGFFKVTFGNAYHVIYRSDKYTTIILSTPQKTFFNYVTTFSYFFIITSFLVLLVGFFFKISPFNWQLALTDFSTKIQLFVIVSIFLSFVLFGWATTYYIKKQNIEKNEDLLQEKVQSVLIELEHKLGEKKELTPESYEEMTYYLVKFSNVFYTDINLYSKSGQLLASSRPEIYERGLTGRQMDTEAYKAIHLAKKSSFTHSENIGDLNYLSTYVPFRNNRNQILAYMNLPYFVKQNELDNELSSFYTALVNVYGLLFLITAVIAVFFANYISEPVRLIKDKISALQLGKSSELLDWKSNDEIGSLVLEYNKKVMELEKSAQLLVQSERESAWREMAKQVAHEIKNPLTPMRLSVQQLERLAKDDAADISERIERTSKMLIDQIDTLTKIANEFSSFAKMPKANEQVIELIPVIESAIDLFKEEQVTISLSNSIADKIMVVADKSQLSRVFNNLFKNAIQAIPETRNGKIEVDVSNSENDVLIAVKDNGSGIPLDKQDKIFVPNFTTKTTGMGLGLAMVKNILENSGGNIRFETEPDVGTTFFIRIPLNNVNRAN